MKAGEAIFVTLFLLVLIALVASPESNNKSKHESPRKARITPKTTETVAATVAVEDVPVTTLINEHQPCGNVQAQQAEQVLESINEAEVDNRTHDLNQVLGRLNDICTKAVGTYDGLLSADFVPKQGRKRLARKEVSK